MANEARITSGLDIMKGTNPVQVDYSARPASFAADVAGAKGPVPGAIDATVAGVSVDFSELTTPALCRIMNLDATNYVEVGIWDPENAKFFPLMELLPGESYVIRLARNLQEEYQTGTGTTGANTNRLRIKANTTVVPVLIEAFEV